MPMSTVRLITFDNVEVGVEMAIAKMSQTISSLVEILATDDEELHPIPLPKVSSVILEKVIEWCSKYKDTAGNADREEEASSFYKFSEWDMKFLNVENQTLFELIIAANYLDIPGLLEITCKAVANMIRGRSPADIRKIFGIENDFTPEQDKQFRNETDWIDQAYSTVSLDKPPEEPFPIMQLPNEVISIIFRKLYTIDRLRARVNTRLFMVESGNRYSIDELIIGKEGPRIGLIDLKMLKNPQRVVIPSDGYWTSFTAILEKLSINVTVNRLVFGCELSFAGRECPRLELLSYLKSISSRQLDINYIVRGNDNSLNWNDSELRLTDLNDKSLEDWTRSRESLIITGRKTVVTGVGLYNLYSAMADSRASLRLFIMPITAQVGISLLGHIGVSYNIYFTSTNRDVRLFAQTNILGKEKYHFVIGENMLISIDQKIVWEKDIDLRIERQIVDATRGAHVRSFLEIFADRFTPVPVPYL